ncbi:hypothetical protein [uncultured Chitinophaga sp.]|uniref:hypothetical protein n=1 Tax=uncultured Chitinophaga sp. TaxID=339340 RepID=UPI0025D166BC|nr:hypothetical protein [uncultured Chitinophaga sp.]
MKLNILLLAVCASLMVAVSCKKADYLTDSGVHSAKTPLTTYEFLKNHPWKSFDTLVTILDHYGLQEEVNGAGTFFAVTNRSIRNYMNMKQVQTEFWDENAKYTMDSLYRDLTADSIRQYMFADKIPVSALTSEDPVLKSSLAGTSMAVRKRRQQVSTDFSFEPVYYLYLVKVRGGLDDPNNPPSGNDPNVDATVLCQTTGIETQNGKGTILHVLQNSHGFVRF